MQRTDTTGIKPNGKRAVAEGTEPVIRTGPLMHSPWQGLLSQDLPGLLAQASPIMYKKLVPRNVSVQAAVPIAIS